jgi:primosomal protein N' (replication factor Y) (superfamily II helicase)
MKQAMEAAGGFTHFSSELLSALKKRLENGEQSLLFLNKRGYHRMQVCAACRHVLKCPHCDLALTFHRSDNFLKCHLCNYSQHISKHCPECRASETLQFRGFGTEHVERALHAIFPEVRTLRMDRDTTQKKRSHEELFKQFQAHKADVLIGTQMIAKGFHFPSVTLVGVLSLDATLSIPDFRSPEHAFQLLTQVAGRAGRDLLPGEVIIQTILPDHPTIHLAAAQDYPTFYSRELEERKSFGYPPFCHLIKVVFSDTDPDKAEEKAHLAYASIQKQLPQGSQILPVVPAGHPKVKDEYRFQFLIKSLKVNAITDILRGLKLDAKIDVDPLSTFF